MSLLFPERAVRYHPLDVCIEIVHRIMFELTLQLIINEKLPVMHSALY